MNQWRWRMEWRPSLSVISRGGHGVGQILLVGKHQQDGVAELVLVEHAVKLVPSLGDAVAIVAIHHEDQTLRVLEVVPPERADLEKRGEEGKFRF